MLSVHTFALHSVSDLAPDQPRLQRRAVTLMPSDAMPPKKRGFASTQEDGDRGATASGSDSPGGHDGTQPRRAPPKLVTVHCVAVSLILTIHVVRPVCA